MSSAAKWTIGVVAVVIVALIIYAVIGSQSTPAPDQTASVPAEQTAQSPSNQSASEASSTAGSTTSPNTVTVVYTDAGFSPASLTIHEGDSVTFINQSSGQMWVASGVHPTHTLYDGTDRTTHCAPGYSGPAPFDECAAGGPGSSYSFTFTKTGTFPFHNHVDASETGTVTVQ